MADHLTVKKCPYIVVSHSRILALSVSFPLSIDVQLMKILTMVDLSMVLTSAYLLVSKWLSHLST